MDLKTKEIYENLFAILKECEAATSFKALITFLDSSSTYKKATQSEQEDYQQIVGPLWDKGVRDNLLKKAQQEWQLKKDLPLPKLLKTVRVKWSKNGLLISCPYSHCNHDTMVQYGIDDIHGGKLQQFQCNYCSQLIVLRGENILYPNLVKFGKSLPEDSCGAETLEFYKEAQSVYQHSQRGAAVLLRAFIEQLLKGKGYLKGHLEDKIDKCCADPKYAHLKVPMHALRKYGNKIHESIFPKWTKEDTENVFNLCHNIVITLTADKAQQELVKKVLDESGSNNQENTPG